MLQTMRLIYPLLILCILIQGCDKSEPVIPAPLPFVEISTDKAIYNPGEVVKFTLETLPEGPVTVRYKFLSKTIDETTLSGSSWTWTPPADDFKGYMVELTATSNDTEQIIGTIAVDVSSNWTVFPRYGFLSRFHQMSPAEMDAITKRLTRFHINGLQFFNWPEKHHKPLAGTVTNPAQSWLDIGYRQTYKSTVDGYIARAHQAGMKAMFYNFSNGALHDADADGVDERWYLYKDNTHSQKASYDPGEGFKRPVYILNPKDAGWQDYLIARNSDVYAAYSFDGMHIDQLPKPGSVFNFYGAYLYIDYDRILNEIRWAHPSKFRVFNYLNSSGWSDSWSTFNSNFIYMELRNTNENFSDLGKFFTLYTITTPPNKKIVLAAHVNRALAGQTGHFNTPSVLLANAAIFALGGSHMELGEHLAAHENLVIGNLAMTPELENSLKSYYDFLTAYENILRDGGEVYFAKLTTLDDKLIINPWPPQIGSVACIGNEMDDRQIFHLINFTDATTLQWRDNEGIQAKPEIITDFKLAFTATREVKKVWFASPDYEKGASKELEYTLDGLRLSFEVPSLEYWSMIVVEY